MKKFLLIITLCAVSLPIYATTKCIQPPTTCLGTRFPTWSNEYLNWGMQCDNMQIIGISHCADTDGTDNPVQSDLHISKDLEKNIHCWCKMTKPVLSKWVYKGVFADASSCTLSCTNNCGYWCAVDAGGLRTKLFENFSEY